MVATFLAGFVFGVIGLAVLKEAKKRGDFRLALIAVVLCVYPYFISNPLLCWGIGALLTAAAISVWRA